MENKEFCCFFRPGYFYLRKLLCLRQRNRQMNIFPAAGTLYHKDPPNLFCQNERWAGRFIAGEIKRDIINRINGNGNICQHRRGKRYVKRQAKFKIQNQKDKFFLFGSRNILIGLTHGQKSKRRKRMVFFRRHTGRIVGLTHGKIPFLNKQVDPGQNSEQ